jgi:hypothetical protein
VHARGGGGAAAAAAAEKLCKLKKLGIDPWIISLIVIISLIRKVFS